MNDLGDVSQDVRDLIYRFALDELRRGVEPSAVEQSLIERGLERADAARVVRRVQQGFASSGRRAHQEEVNFAVFSDVLLFLGGLVISLGGYFVADLRGEATFFALCGTLIFGYIKFLRIVTKKR
ncbi:MAG: hypothetical protein QM775_04035 [Pirellulales bacterium]